MKCKFTSLLIAVLLLIEVSCQNKKADETTLANPDVMHTSVRKLTDVMVHDIFSPPVASRVYAYANIAAYEALVPGYPQYQTLTGQLTGLKELPKPTAGQEYCYPLASLRAFLTVGRTLTFSGDMVDEFEPQVYQKYKEAGLDEEVYNRSMAYGEAVGKKILEWANQDGYRETRGRRYTVVMAPGKWQPTPPAYMDAVEPYWFKIRPFALDSCSQFKPAVPSKFDISKSSDFYKEVLQVYETGKSLTTEQKAIASFWDCNPFVMHNTGHVMYATKKISPGGHWINIAAVASKKAKADFMKTVETYALVSIALADGFISCWDEKYRSARIRPETVINTYMDKDWVPLLQTPPFPEYPSGHSVISNAAAVTLTSLYGENFAYTDSTEVVFGLSPRKFSSFNQAAEEAAISRLYGGIHYLPAITNGQTEGRLVGEFVLGKIKTRKAGNKAKQMAKAE
ncbi:phosphatidic acid phosphatase [Adhaeribacter arboris]|uniref:Phosphatidic acid phosphatase n=1 Tax=Adhaeribacter arboris TaxID=2072846 RepID=A0A2T2YIY6_9BACT|nr:vanadium-dependent haloperoxidase [Adhaeribacter arboris]PSR55466.1 phosphatidic acid phosphatase [Adhaeribacter arboris]